MPDLIMKVSRAYTGYLPLEDISPGKAIQKWQNGLAL